MASSPAPLSASSVMRVSRLSCYLPVTFAFLRVVFHAQERGNVPRGIRRHRPAPGEEVPILSDFTESLAIPCAVLRRATGDSGEANIRSNSGACQTTAAGVRLGLESVQQESYN
jgi:hypothetical protein